MKPRQDFLGNKIDYSILWLYFAIVVVGLLCIFMVEYRANNLSWWQSFISGKTNYSKQFFFMLAALAGAIVIVNTDSKAFTAFAYLLYGFGIALMLATFFIGHNVKGSRSWIPLIGGFNLQAAELCKLFTGLALSKYLSNPDTHFEKLKSKLIASCIILLPALLSIFQHELGVALVYSAFFIVLYREGLPAMPLIIIISLAVIVIGALLIPTEWFTKILSIIFIGILFTLRKYFKKNRSALWLAILIWVFCLFIQRLGVPYLFNNMFECYQSTRIYNMLGKEYDCHQNVHVIKNLKKNIRKPDDYNVRQSKIAIGSGGFFGKGFLQGTQTRGRYVPEQHTDFIFTSLGEAYGFVGSIIFLGLYCLLLFRIIQVGERQRSSFSRIFAYCVAAVLFFHIAVNVSMTIGLFPIVGIPLPLVSYGGTSLLTFTAMIFILLKLDTDRQMVLR